ncbi:hypothetical protein Pla52o_57360 [Novipirellula galeiformis]|uniref:Uncharacterized protein n=1 Tax=Novipirellula galeiformis TaxID=2528004 RepID=A0A5C6BE82_9BACT|nr:hypothetical protein [Novipirellula galeiformis]TWU10280.1 hypothetical protein Pla52o_57360 [Novipirellula galeiformis]
MIWVALTFTLLFVAAFVLKAKVVWDASHDIYSGGGVPTLDFPVFFPPIIAFGVSSTLRLAGLNPFPFFGIVIWLGLTVSAAMMMWYFDHVGAPERLRQLDAIQSRNPEGGEP